MVEVLPIIVCGTILHIAVGEETEEGVPPAREGEGSSSCVDRLGGLVGHGDRYTPRGKDPCERCTCQRGRPDSCSITSCYPPAQCHAPYLRGSGECCDYACNGTTLGSPDGSDVLSATNLGLRLVASTVTSFLILALLLFMIHRLRKRRLLVMIRRLNGCRAAADLEDACLARQLALDDRGGFLVGREHLALGLGGLCPDPPPPYSFWKPPEAYVPPGEAPPPYEAPPAPPPLPPHDDAHQPCDQVSRITQTTPPLCEAASSSSSSSEGAEPGGVANRQRAIRSDAYYEDGPHVTVVRVGEAEGGRPHGRVLSQCEPHGRRLVQDGDKRLSLQGPAVSQSNGNAQYPDPTSWHGEEEGGSETTSSGSASPQGRPGAFSPTTSESSASGEVNEVAARASANARPTKARRSLDRTLQQLRRFSIPRKKNTAKEPGEGLSGACCFSHGSSATDADGRVRAVPRDRRAEADGSTRGSPSLPSENVVKVKKGGKRALLFTSSRDGSVGRKDRRGDGADDDVPAHRERRNGRPDSLELPTATSTLKGRSSAIPVTITVKCRPVRTECAPSARTEERGSSRSSSVCSETGERRLRTPESPSAADGGSERVAAVQSYGEASAGRVPRQSVARHVARLEAEGFRPPDASAPRRQGRGDRPHCQGHES
uniref:Putative e3 ubiquitin-protein ligase icp0 n=1 Tax=Ixodes ricinus TaxID=34613 RepID=A0A147BPC0_IXORI